MWVSVQIRASGPSSYSDDSYMQSMELSGISPRGGIFPGAQDGGSMPLMLGDGSTFSQSSILSANPSQLMWKRVTRGLEAKIFRWSCVNERNVGEMSELWFMKNGPNESSRWRCPGFWSQIQANREKEKKKKIQRVSKDQRCG